MGTKTGISWTDATWNPIRGCSRVSEGCRHCYAESIAHRFSGPGLAYEGLVQLDAAGKSTGKWNGKIKFVEEHLLDPLRWKEPRRIFVNSMSDLFHENVTDEMCDRIFAVMALCPQHTFQVLTKRPERMLAYLNTRKLKGRSGAGTSWAVEMAICGFLEEKPSRALINHVNDYSDLIADKYPHGDGFVREWPLPNVNLGVSVENQKTADERIPLLLQTPAAVRFISAEPLLGAMNLRSVARPGDSGGTFDSLLKSTLDGRASSHLDWVIVGGESGAGARPMHPGWARSLRDQCKAAGVPFFFKQWGEYGPGSVNMTTGESIFRKFGDMQQWINKASTWIDGGVCLDACGVELKNGDDFQTARYPVTVVHPVGKKAAGCLLDGVEHHEFPRAHL